MENVIQHECSKSTRRECLATEENPYHFTDSGLSNVYLVGIRYFVCECGRILAEIPAAKQLMAIIARDLVWKPTALAAEEIRFLRKRLGEKQADFAKHIGVRAETLCRFETGETSTNERTDKLMRLYYALASDDPVLIEGLRKTLQELLARWLRDNSPARIVATVKDNEWEANLVAA
jgi:putative zinc finger/helix-turn-helix YgiT family protein